MKRSLIFLSLFILGFLYAHAQDEVTAASVYNEGLEALKGKDYGTALELMQKALEVADPEEDAKVISLAQQNGSIAAYYHGRALDKEKKYDEAVAAFDKGIELNPKSYTNYLGKAQSLNDMDKIVESVDMFIMASDKAVEGGKAENAEKYLDRAGNIVGTTFSKGMHDEAIAAGIKVLEKLSDPEVEYYVAKSYFEKGDFESALIHIDVAVEAGSDDGKYIFTKGEILEKKGDKAGAVAAFSKVPAGKYFENAQYRAKQLGS